MARRVAYLVFLLPIVISIPIAAFVLIDILDQPDRELDMWPIGDGGGHSSSIAFIELYNSYSISQPIEISAKITDIEFDCGDVYITIYDDNNKPISQNAYFEQCFTQNNSLVPIGETFSEKLDNVGKYQVVLEILDKKQTITDSKSVTITVK